MSGLFKKKYGVTAIFCLVATGLLVVANADDKQQASQAKKITAPKAKSTLAISVAGKKQLTDQIFFPELTKFEKQFQGQLNENVDADFVDTPLADVMRFYANSTGANIVIMHYNLEEEGLTKEEPITISLEDISLKTALELILDPLGLTYIVDRDVVKITTKYCASETLKTRVYPVGDFGKTPNDYIALEVAIRNASLGLWREGGMLTGPSQTSSGGGGGFFQFGDHRSQGYYGTIVGSQVCEGGEGGTISVVPQSKSLVISQTYRAHEAITALLTQLRQARNLD